MFDLICDKCGGSNIYTVIPEPEKEPQKKKMSEFNSINTTTLVYKLTTIKCKDCGFEHRY